LFNTTHLPKPNEAMMHEETPPITQETPLRESSQGWPWGQLFILLCCLWFCLIGLADLLVIAGVGAHELIRSTADLFIVLCLVAGILALHHSSRLKERGERLRRFPRLRLVNIGLSGLGVFLLVMSMIIPAANKARESARRGEQRQSAKGADPERLQTIRSANGLFAIDIPADWEAAPDVPVGANGVARSDIANDLWVAMWSEPKEDLAISSIEKYAERIIKLLEAEYKQLEVVERTSSSVPGHPTTEIVVRAVVEDARLMIAMRFVEMPRHFVQVRVWAFPSRFRTHEATLRQILRSVRRE
jgi:hypothetical protein